MDYLKLQLCLEQVIQKSKSDRNDLISTIIQYASEPLKSALEFLRVKYIGSLSLTYTIIKEIASGAFGRVLAVQDKKSKNKYALKMIKTQNKVNEKFFWKKWPFWPI